MTPLDRAVRAAVYRRIVECGEAPAAEALAAELGRPAAEVEASLLRLAEAHLLTLRPGGTDVWMAHPFSAVPTPFAVRTPRGERWANCAWDALGIAALLDTDAECHTPCPDGCGATVDLSVRGGRPADPGAVVHFAVPARAFWDDIGFT